MLPSASDEASACVPSAKPATSRARERTLARPSSSCELEPARAGAGLWVATSAASGAVDALSSTTSWIIAACTPASGASRVVVDVRAGGGERAGEGHAGCWLGAGARRVAVGRKSTPAQGGSRARGSCEGGQRSTSFMSLALPRSTHETEHFARGASACARDTVGQTEVRVEGTKERMVQRGAALPGARVCATPSLPFPSRTLLVRQDLQHRGRSAWSTDGRSIVGRVASSAPTSCGRWSAGRGCGLLRRRRGQAGVDEGSGADESTAQATS